MHKDLETQLAIKKRWDLIRDCTLCLRKEHEANHSGSKSVFSNRETPPFDAEILYKLINNPISHELDEISCQPVDDSLDPGLAVNINNNEIKLMEITNVAFGRFFFTTDSTVKPTSRNHPRI